MIKIDDIYLCVKFCIIMNKLVLKKVNMDYDQVLNNIGQFGLWQILICILASLAAMAAAMMTMQVRL